MKNNQEKTDSDIKVTALCLFLSILIFLIDIAVPLGVAVGVLYITVVLASLWSSKKQLTLFAAIGASILTIAGFYLSPSGGELWKVLLNRGIALFAIWITAVLSIQRKSTQEEREKAVAELKILSGLLPICSSCKKIRNDDGSWEQIELYIRDHSEAEFSHGICHECSEKLYPGIKIK